MNRPKFLYHASPECDLKKIEPRLKTIPEGFSNGPVVFATDILAFSTNFLVFHDDSWANGGAFGEDLFFVISDRERFMKADKGGNIYLVPSNSFKKYNKREWFSTKAVKTQGFIHFSRGLMAMIVNGVQVYFVDKKTYKNIQNAQDHGVSILNSLTSENEKLGLPVKKLDFYRGSKKLI